ncbi:Glucose/arabinose dehydrogenase, beta-propeller fold [Tropicibacter naphthalenivorans]|uniref:Soluble aldose sugar dehydrogenase YliI n=1 Tax=Tropicibacter naphthalenivorans TaxID=441103 RepID=A0A0P1GH09_9RHOB|nr:Soluble aldose sugar dehydrogenase YliI precursor [Tropicibacter naphthalenivorans]SMC97866.1 Glucose/arabinose dehydrogenase, beta-propeller fold [Tropicibacter naphthalenivorans]
MPLCLHRRAAPAAFAAVLTAATAAQAHTTVLEGLDYPWDIEAAGETLFLTEKGGTLGVLSQGAFTRHPLVTRVPILNDRGGGLMGLALTDDPLHVVLYHHAGTPSDRYNRVIEAELQGDAFVETRVLIDDIPGHPLYNGGRVAFGPDGMLYVTTGWTENPDLPQDLESLAGKILRVTPDGDIPTGNPFDGSLVWSLGHRNPQGIAWDDAGTMYAAEHGQSGHDEVNRITAGGNYGWPLVQGDETGEGLTPPLAHSGGRTWAPSGLAWGEDGLLLASLRQGAVLAVSQDGTVRQAYDAGARIRDVLAVGHTFYAITTNRSPRRDGPSEDYLIRLD